jgi:hypothetical protein
MKRLTIDRQTWLRGEGFAKSFLLRPSDGKMCCLGFLGRDVCGLSPEHLEGKKSPGFDFDLTEEWTQVSSLITYAFESIDLIKLMTINDDSSRSDSQREVALTDIFAKHDIQVKFIN